MTDQLTAEQEARFIKRREQREARNALYERDLSTWTDAELAGELERNYSPTKIPPCRVCGCELSLQAFGGGGPSKWACSGQDDDWKWLPGRSAADDHYIKSGFEDQRSGGDESVIELLRRSASERDAHAETQADPLSLCACNHCRRLGRGAVMLYRDQECPTCAALAVDDAERAAVAELGARAAGAEQRATKALAEADRLRLRGNGFRREFELEHAKRTKATNAVLRVARQRDGHRKDQGDMLDELERLRSELRTVYDGESTRMTEAREAAIDARRERDEAWRDAVLAVDSGAVVPMAVHNRIATYRAAAEPPKPSTKGSQ